MSRRKKKEGERKRGPKRESCEPSVPPAKRPSRPQSTPAIPVSPLVTSEPLGGPVTEASPYGDMRSLLNQVSANGKCCCQR